MPAALTVSLQHRDTAPGARGSPSSSSAWRYIADMNDNIGNED
jgi:hypothetical protein